MNLMWYNIISMKRLVIILTFILFFINPFAYASSNIIKKDIKVVSKDGFSMCATLEYPKILKKQKEIPTVVLLHSLGYSSSWWGTLPDELMNKGYAVVLIDLRGHGSSVYNSKLLRVSWKNLTNTAFTKYPDDVVNVLEYIKTENSKKDFFKNWAVVGADIGANTGILAVNKFSEKPKTIVMLSPSVESRGLYIPVKLAELNNIDILSIEGTNDNSSFKANEYLKKFAQSEYSVYTSESRSTGMMLLKNDKSLSKIVVAWIEQYLK